MARSSYQRALVALTTLCIAPAGTASAGPFDDQLVQAPSLGAPQRGSLAGTLSKLAFGPGDLARGVFGLPLPIDLPGERGPVLAKIAPSYSPETGITEWGMGWQAELKIQRFQPVGEVDFATDQFTSPWGRLVTGDDGSYYPTGLTHVVRVTAANGGWIAQSSDGTTYRFNAADSVTTPQGTFAWMLSRVDTVLGDSTTLTWTHNASGRPFLDNVQWGGRGDGTQYKLTLAYAPVAPFVSYASGARQILDQRVSQLTLGVKQGSGYAVRWHYDLEYGAGPSGPAYYLERVTRTYASGAVEPAVTYQYDRNSELWASTQLAHTPTLDQFIVENGSAAIQPDRATVMDLEEDGLLDLETAFDHTTVRQHDGGYTIEALPVPTGPIESQCRPMPSPFNKPRRLARMHGGAADPQVVVVKKIGLGSSTRILVCDRLGVAVFDGNVSGDWEPGANTRLADVDVDKRPDLVRVRNGQVAVLRNTSSGPQSLSFAPGAVTVLTPQVVPVASWLVDLNGDGRTDLMVRHAGGVVAWFGAGHGAFDPIGRSYAFLTASGTSLPGLANYQFSHGDFNGDGMSDLLLTQGQTVLMFINTGATFVQTVVPGLQGIPWTVTFPVIADLAGTGNESAMFVNGDQVLALQLTSPSTGLLRSANDGKGTVIRFGYGRAFPSAGIAHRYATLTGLTVESSGYDPVSYDYHYGAPVLHTAGRYLIGFTSVDKDSPVITERVTFHNDDDISGVRDRSEDRDDRTPGIVRFTQRLYDEATFHGVRWLRPSSVETGHRNAGGTTLSTITEYVEYERERCPTVVATTGPSGQLITATTLATTPAIPDDLHCTAGSLGLTGTHTDPALDFNYAVELSRNALGQVTRVTQYGSAVDVLILQDISYGADHRITAAGSPGRGTTSSQYDALGRLAELTDPVGIVTSAGAIDPVSDALLALQTSRPGAVSNAFFQYDSKERLHASWDDVSGASQAQPLKKYLYQDATSTAPGRIDTQTLADAAGGISQHTVDLLAADGATLVSGTWLGGSFALGAAAIDFRNTLTRRSSFIGALSEPSLAALTSADLRAMGTPLAETEQAGFGHAIRTTKAHQAGVVGTVTHELILGATELITRTHQPGGFVAESAFDAAGKLVRKTDENGITHRYRYDVLGRLVHIETPDGDHRLAFDGFGRPMRVSREGIGEVLYSYDPVSGLPVRKQRLDANGAVLDTADTAYDATGRAQQVSQTAGSATSTVAFDRDGKLGSVTVPGQLGHLTRVRGDGWERRELFDALGRAVEQRITLNGWRNATRHKTYRADGSVASDTLTISEPGGPATFSATKATTLDALGRVSTLSVDGTVLYTLSYDSEGRLARADFTSGEEIVFDYDPVTRQGRGHSVEAANVSGGVGWERDARGLIAAETFTRGAAKTRREYTYDGRGALLQAATATEVATYSYTASGLPDSITDLAGTRSVHHTSQAMSIGGVVYSWDSAGRVVGKGAWTLAYGPHGQLARATRPGRQIDFVYDEGNRRLLKRVDGVPVRAEVAGGVLTEGHFVELVVVGGVVAGILDNGVFTALLTDPRGTPFAGSSGEPGLATPYGVRAAPLGVSDVIDYTRLGWDPDLDVVRMGARDYDPKLSQFLTPDPLYFEDLEKCLSSPLQCSLYGYAGGNPLNFVDPSGLDMLDFITEEVAPRVVGALQTAAGFLIAAAGVAMCTTGVGCVLGAVVAVYGVSMATGGAKNAVNGTYERHPVNQGLALLVGQDFADGVDVAAGALSLGNAASRSPYFAPRPAPSPPPSPPPSAPPPAPAAPALRRATEMPMGGNGVVLRDGAGATTAEMAASRGGPTGGSRLGQADVRIELLNEASRTGQPFMCWRCGHTSTNPADMHVGHRNVATSNGGNLSRTNVCLEGAACNLSANNRGGPSPGMSCAERGSCGAPYNR